MLVDVDCRRLKTGGEGGQLDGAAGLRHETREAREEARAGRGTATPKRGGLGE